MGLEEIGVCVGIVVEPEDELSGGVIEHLLTDSDEPGVIEAQDCRDQADGIWDEWIGCGWRRAVESDDDLEWMGANLRSKMREALVDSDGPCVCWDEHRELHVYGLYWCVGGCPAIQSLISLVYG